MRLRGLDQPYGPAERVHLDALAAVTAAQVLVEQPLESALPDHVAAPVAALLELLVIHLAHVAQEVRRETARRIRALRLDLHDHTRELELPLLDLRDVVHREPAPEADRKQRIGRHARNHVDELLVRDLEERREATEHRVAPVRFAVQLAWNERQRERRPVVYERRPVAVEQDAARRRDGSDADAVLLRGLVEASALEDLEIPELTEHDEECRRDDSRHRHDPPLPGVALARERRGTETRTERPAHQARRPTHCAEASANASSAPRKPL